MFSNLVFNHTMPSRRFQSVKKHPSTIRRRLAVRPVLKPRTRITRINARKRTTRRHEPPSLSTKQQVKRKPSGFRAKIHTKPTPKPSIITKPKQQLPRKAANVKSVKTAVKVAIRPIKRLAVGPLLAKNTLITAAEKNFRGYQDLQAGKINQEEYQLVSSDLTVLSGLQALESIRPLPSGDVSRRRVVLPPRSLKLTPGGTIQWLKKEGLLKPVPKNAICQGCYLPLEAVTHFCKRCKSEHAKPVNASIDVVIYAEEDNKPPSIEVINSYAIVNALRNAATYQGIDPIIIIRSGFTKKGEAGHANALFFYLFPARKQIEVRLFDSNKEESTQQYAQVYELEEITVRMLRDFLPMYFGKILPSYRVSKQNFGENCPIGLQANEFNDPAKKRALAILKTELDKVGTETDELLDKYKSARNALETQQKALQTFEKWFQKLPQQQRNARYVERKTFTEKTAKIEQEIDRLWSAFIKESEIREALYAEYDSKSKEMERLKAEQTQLGVCHSEPGGYCESWSAVVSLIHIAFPESSVDEIATDIYNHFKSEVPYLRELIQRFSFNLYLETYDPEKPSPKPCCSKDSQKHYPFDVCT